MKSYSHILYMSFLSFLISVTDLLSVVILVPYLYLKFGSDVSLGYFSRYPSLTQDIDTLMVSAVVLLFCIRVLSVVIRKLSRCAWPSCCKTAISTSFQAGLACRLAKSV